MYELFKLNVIEKYLNVLKCHRKILNRMLMHSYLKSIYRTSVKPSLLLWQNGDSNYQVITGTTDHEISIYKEPDSQSNQALVMILLTSGQSQTYGQRSSKVIFGYRRRTMFSRFDQWSNTCTMFGWYWNLIVKMSSLWMSHI